jgi:hypothetical protein
VGDASQRSINPPSTCRQRPDHEAFVNTPRAAGQTTSDQESSGT